MLTRGSRVLTREGEWITDELQSKLLKEGLCRGEMQGLSRGIVGV